MNIHEEGLKELVSRGGVYYDINGANPREVITGLINSIQLKGKVNVMGPDRESLLQAVLEREALMTTAVGHGIALPHPRNPPVSDPSAQFVAIGFLKQPVDWKALDGELIHTAILIVSASPKFHLHTLSAINYFCQQGSFRKLLEKRVAWEEIIREIADAEKTWK
jgi:PTS system nitrogen regulatory IIA component